MTASRDSPRTLSTNITTALVYYSVGVLLFLSEDCSNLFFPLFERTAEPHFFLFGCTFQRGKISVAYIQQARHIYSQIFLLLFKTMLYNAIDTAGSGFIYSYTDALSQSMICFSDCAGTS